MYIPEIIFFLHRNGVKNPFGELAAVINHFLMVYAIIAIHDFLTVYITIAFRISEKAIKYTIIKYNYLCII